MSTRIAFVLPRSSIVASSSRSRAVAVAVANAAPRCLLHTTTRLLDAGPSNLETSLRNALKAAMKARDRAGSTTLKAVLAEITNAHKSSADPSAPLAESVVLRTLRKSIAERADASGAYPAGSDGRLSLEKEIELLSSFAPRAPSAETLQTSVEGVVQALTEEERRQKGVQGTVMKRVVDALGEQGGAVDRKELGRVVSEAVKKLLKA